MTIRHLPFTLLLALTACADVGAPPLPEAGVSASLAAARRADLSDIAYDLRFAIPDSAHTPVTGSVTVSFTRGSAEQPLVLDFRAPADRVLRVLLDGDSLPATVSNGHIVIPANRAGTGPHTVSIDFISTDDALNRNPEFLYALFVPDRASTAFPGFDQPDLKARYRLTLDIPAAWQGLANGSLTAVDSTSPTRHLLTFRETAPISTYLFSFAAGRLTADTATRNGRLFTMYHRETDTAKVTRNRDAIFDLHAGALAWLEEYTGIAYPFGKFDFFAVPSFQFGGMEHPGAVWYRAGSLFLDESATRNQELGRASLIAHETAHMWFGDLVTMEWFNDVWMKEVFANFMAAKIVRPAFPDVDHDLRFFLAHHPVAYGADRTRGANPIRQELDNLRNAGSLYGAIIYQKAPVVMRQLEQLIGDTAMRAGLREYLQEHRFGNATWPDLVAILDRHTTANLADWSRIWVESPGRPQLRASWVDGTLHLTQHDPARGRGLRWTEPVGVLVGDGDSTRLVELLLRNSTTTTSLTLTADPRFLLPGADGVSYGRMQLDSTSRTTLLTTAATLRTPLWRATAWSALFESMLGHELAPRLFADALIRAVPAEPDDLVLQQLLGLLETAFWRFLPHEQRLTLAPRIEETLWTALERAGSAGRKGAFWNSLVDVTLSDSGVARLERVWRHRAPPVGLPLSESQYISLAEALALRTPARGETILTTQEGRITNPDRLARFQFVRQALAHDAAAQDAFMARLARVEERRREPWVLSAVGYLNHPLRAPASERFLHPSLELVDEIQTTGDIFFPLGWMQAVMGGHQSRKAAEIVARYLAEHPRMPQRLQGKMLQAADDLFRAARIVDGWRGGLPLEDDAH